MFEAAAGAAAFVAGAIASVAGFGIGSILTPLLALHVGTQLAVAAVSIPHFLGTALRFAMLRGHLDKHVLLNFGVLSAAGGVAGALLHSAASNPLLTAIFGGALIFAGLAALTGYSQRMRFGRRTAWAAGAVSGVLGGLVGNQGGIRSAALLGFGLPKDSFVATATAIGLIVDAARMPVYSAISANRLHSISAVIAIASVGVLIGTLFGTKVLRRVPQRLFNRTVGALVLMLGIVMLAQAVA